MLNLANDEIVDRHWAEIDGLVGFSIKADPDFTLGDVVTKKVTDHAEAITNISTSATQEAGLERMMAKVEGIWKATALEVKPYKDVKDLYVLGDTSEVVAGLDDSLVTVNTVLSSRFVAGIRESVDAWKQKLLLFSETLDEWLACQRTWMYLETIFAAPDIIRQLPQAAKAFKQVDTSFRLMMKQTNDDSNALKACTVDGRRAALLAHNSSLDSIQKNLEDYLETKRAAFARFYYLSNDELLEILASAKDPQAVQPHLRKCFEALVLLEFGKAPGSIDIEAMISPEKEKVGMGNNLKARGNVEDWLTKVEERMKEQLWKSMKTALQNYDERPRAEWVSCAEHPGQCVASIAQVAWSRGTEKALLADDSPAQMQSWYEEQLEDLQDLIKLIQSNLTSYARKVIVALVTTDVHARDVTEGFVDRQVIGVVNFDWVQQLRCVPVTPLRALLLFLHYDYSLLPPLFPP